MTHSHLTRRGIAIVLSAAAMALSWSTSVGPAAATSLFTLVSSCGRFDPNAFPFGTCEDVDANGNPPVDHGGFPVPGVPQKVASVRDDFTLRPTDPYTYLGIGIATAGFGHVGSFAQMEELQAFQDSFGVINAGSADARAESRDTLTFSAGTTVQFGFKLDGPGVGVCDFGGASGFGCDHAFGRATSRFSANIGPTGAVLFEVDQEADSRTTQTFGTFDPQTHLLLSAPVAITGPMDLEMFSDSTAGTEGPIPPFLGRFSTQAFANFGDTATLTEILVFDGAGNLLPDVTITSASGTVYPLAAAGMPVPEPSTLLLVGAGLAGFLASRCRQCVDCSTRLSRRDCRTACGGRRNTHGHGALDGTDL